LCLVLGPSSQRTESGAREVPNGSIFGQTWPPNLPGIQARGPDVHVTKLPSMGHPRPLHLAVTLVLGSGSHFVGFVFEGKNKAGANAVGNGFLPRTARDTSAISELMCGSNPLWLLRSKQNGFCSGYAAMTTKAPFELHDQIAKLAPRLVVATSSRAAL
jgi:hypothetical protein